MDKPETGNEFELLLRQQAAAQRVCEMILTHLFVRIAGMTDNPTEFVRLLMINVEDNIRQAARAIPQADMQAHQAATDTIEYFEDLSGRLMAMITPKTTKN
jgi:flagellin-specific chaperone FliS